MLQWKHKLNSNDKLKRKYTLNRAQGGRIGTGLNYLLGEDDQNARVPVAEGGRMGFKDGTKFDPKLRAVLKGIAALSAKIVGKQF